MKGTKIVMQKELARVFGDKKLIFSLFILPAIIMVGIYSLVGKMATQMESDIQEHVPVMYIQNEPEDFETFIKSVGFKADIKTLVAGDSIEGLKAGILSGEIDLVVSFPEGFLPAIQDYQDGDTIPEVKTYYNPTEDYSSQARETFLGMVLTPYQQQLLAARVGNLERLTIFNVDLDSNTSKIMDEDKANGKTLSMMLPYLIIMLLFTGPMSLGIDAITGEKERGTMASMLVTPLKRGEIVMGKILSLSILSCLSAVVYAGSMIIAMPMMYSGFEGEAISANLSIVQMFELLLVMLTLVYLYVSIVSLIAVFAKTAKEAGTYISPVYIVVIVAGLLTIFSGNSELPLGLYGIPVFGGAACIQKIMINDLSAAQFGANMLGTIAVAVIFTYLITRAFNNEKVMFNA